MYTVTEIYQDHFKWYYVFILSNSPKFTENLLKAVQKMRNPVHNLETCAKFLEMLSRFAQLLAGSEQVVNR